MSSPFESLLNQIICGDAQEILEQLPEESIDCVVTSPPYWSLRDYSVQGQLGLEASFASYIDTLCSVFDEIKRVLKTSGTCFVVLGDTYSTRGSRNGGWSEYLQSRRAPGAQARASPARPQTPLASKCLLQIPSRFAIEMIARGWILRNEVIWHKPNCMPASIKDRFTVDFEKIFFFVKSARYYFAQQFEPLQDSKRLMRRLISPSSKRKRVHSDLFIPSINPKTVQASQRKVLGTGRNKRCVWSIPTRPFKGNHFAAYPPDLIEVPIKAGCPKGGVVLDPFVGSGTTALVARSLGRSYIGIDLSPRYVRMAQARLARQLF